MRDFYKSFILYLAVVALAACGTFGLATPQTFNQKLAYAYGSVTSVRLVAKDLLVGKSITPVEAQSVQDNADNARSILDVAREAANKGDTTTAEGKLKIAQSILTSLQAYLKSKGGNI